MAAGPPYKSGSGTLIASATLHWKHFDQYFSDAACFSYDATKIKPQKRDEFGRQERYTRAGIVHSALALESAANCCLDALKLAKGALEDFEKLPTLAKFDLFLRHAVPGMGLDRQHLLVKPIQNLISCRNSYVHSKVRVETAIKSKLKPAVWAPLGLPKNSVYWQPLHAVKTFTVLSDFLNFYFFELLGYPYEGHEGRSVAVQILSSAVKAIEGEKLPGSVESACVKGAAWYQAHRAAGEWDLEFTFLGVYTTGAGNKQIFPKRSLGDYSHCRVEELKIPMQPIAYDVPSGIGLILVGEEFVEDLSSDEDLAD
jgi:hypothetical protein